jgi:hypothetical protein
MFLAVRIIFRVDIEECLSPIIIIPEKDSKLRSCVHFKRLHVVTKKDPLPISFIGSSLRR